MSKRKNLEKLCLGCPYVTKKLDGNDRNGSAEKYSCLEKSKHLTFLEVCCMSFKYCCIYRQIER